MNALLAPAVAGQFDAEIEQIVEAAHKLGFTRVIEVASGADEVALHEAEEFKVRMGRGEPFMTTSCCYAYTETVRKHIPDLKRFVASTKTPLAITAERARAEHPGALNVFIGPCIAKKQEGMDNDDIDYVLTFEEFSTMLDALRIVPAELAGEVASHEAGSLGRGFPGNGRTLQGDITQVPRIAEGADLKGRDAGREDIEAIEGAAEDEDAPVQPDRGDVVQARLRGRACRNRRGGGGGQQGRQAGEQEQSQIGTATPTG